MGLPARIGTCSPVSITATFVNAGENVMVSIPIPSIDHPVPGVN